METLAFLENIGFGELLLIPVVIAMMALPVVVIVLIVKALQKR